MALSHKSQEVQTVWQQVGSGKYTYEVNENWARMPDGMSLGEVSAAAVDSQDRVYVFQRKDPPVVVFDRDGNFLNSWGRRLN